MGGRTAGGLRPRLIYVNIPEPSAKPATEIAMCPIDFKTATTGSFIQRTVRQGELTTIITSSSIPDNAFSELI